MTRARFTLTLKAKAAKLGDEMVVFGLMSCSVTEDGTRVVDSQDDVINIKELEKGAYGYVADSRGMGLEHSKFQGIGRVIESCVFTPEKIEHMAKAGIEISSSPQAWWIGYKVDDPAVWERVKSGELNAFSWGGFARRTPVATEKRAALHAAGIAKSKAGAGGGDLFELTDLEINEGSLVGDPANPKAKVAFFKRAAGKPLAEFFSKTKAALATLFKPAQKDAMESPPSMQEVLDQREWLEEWWELRDAFDTAVRGIMCSDLPADQQSALLQESTQQFLDALTTLNSDGGAEKSATGAGIDLAELDAALADVLAQGITTTLLEDVKNTLDGLEKAAGAPVRTEKKEQPMPKTAAEIMKGLSAEDRAVLEAAQKASTVAPESDAVAKRLDAIEKENVALREQAQKAAADLEVQKAATKKMEKTALVKGLTVPGLTHDQMVAKLLKEDGTDEEKLTLSSWKAITETFEPLTKMQGHSGVNTEAMTPVEQELQKAMAPHLAKGLNADGARAAVLAADRGLAKRLIAEGRGKSRAAAN